MTHSKSDGWNLDQGLAAQYALHTGINPDLAASAGDKAWDVLKSLRNTIDEKDPQRRAKRVSKTRRLLAKVDLVRHPHLAKAIQTRLGYVLESAEPSINPETGLQEFFVPPLPTRKPSDTQAFFWRDRWAKYKPDIEFAQIAKDVFQSDMSEDYDAHARRNAQMGAFVNKWLPTNPSLDQLPQGEAQGNDFLRLQGVNPRQAHLAPTIDTSLLRSKVNANGSDHSRSATGFEAISSADIAATHFFDPRDQSLRLRIREVLNDDPMYDVYNWMKNTQDRSTIRQQSGRAMEGRKNSATFTLPDRVSTNRYYP